MKYLISFLSTIILIINASKGISQELTFLENYTNDTILIGESFRTNYEFLNNGKIITTTGNLTSESKFNNTDSITSGNLIFINGSFFNLNSESYISSQADSYFNANLSNWGSVFSNSKIFLYGRTTNYNLIQCLTNFNSYNYLHNNGIIKATNLNSSVYLYGFVYNYGEINSGRDFVSYSQLDNKIGGIIISSNNCHFYGQTINRGKIVSPVIVTTAIFQNIDSLITSRIENESNFSNFGYLNSREINSFGYFYNSGQVETTNFTISRGTNNSSINIPIDGEFEILSSFLNNGTIVNYGTINISEIASFTNSGTIINHGTIIVNGLLKNADSIEIKENSAINLIGTARIDNLSGSSFIIEPNSFLTQSQYSLLIFREE